MSEDIVQGVIETIDCANQHRLRMAELVISLDEATSQINSSSTDAEKHIIDHFTKLKSELESVIHARKEELLQQVHAIKKGSLEPLQQCKDMIQEEVNNTNSVLKEGKQLLCGDHDSSQDAMISFKKKANELDLNSLPEVPPLSEVPCLFADLPEAALQHLQQEINDYGRVLSRAPVQITEVAERPGGILVKWAEIEEESVLDLSEFRLQYVSGEVKPADCDKSYVQFNDAYVGASTSFTVRNLSPLKTYTFRVCGRAEEAESWSPWSIPNSAITTLPHHEWESNNKNYEITQNNRLAQRVGGGTGSIIYSNCASYACGHTIIFKILETGSVTLGDGIGLSTRNSHTDVLQQQGTLFISSQGTVYIDGQERTTKLPCLHRKSTLIFETEVLQSGKVRVTIEVDDKIATFDWTIDNVNNASPSLPLGSPISFSGPNPDNDEAIRLYFAMKFANEEWKVAVE